jgi:5'-methylthioadenosine phosphorylase
MGNIKIGIIGGSGLDDPKLLLNYNEKEVDTPYGKPSSSITCGKINSSGNGGNEVEVCILARHGKKHEIPPTQVNNRANIFALGKLGCEFIIATTACGSLREEIGRGDFVILDQFIDFTKQRKLSFFEKFEEGKAKHTPMADPFSEFLREKIISSCKELGIKHHEKGCVVTIEGPRFSTRAESNMFRQWGADVINMSIAPEAILANEAGIKYAAIAMSTDYDCWKTNEKPVSWEEILKIFSENAEKMKKLLIKTIEKIARNEIENTEREFIKSKIRTIPHWPKPGVMFRDITTLLKDAQAFGKVIDILENRYKNQQIDFIAGIESRGFIIASALATRLKKGVIPIRKPNKLPAEVVREEYSLEYGKDAVEIHRDAIKQNDRVLLVDDLLATGGTATATCNLIEKLGGEVIECCFVIDLPELGGSKKLKEKGFNVFNIVSFEGE